MTAFSAYPKLYAKFLLDRANGFGQLGLASGIFAPLFLSMSLGRIGGIGGSAALACLALAFSASLASARIAIDAPRFARTLPRRRGALLGECAAVLGFGALCSAWAAAAGAEAPALPLFAADAAWLLALAARACFRSRRWLAGAAPIAGMAVSWAAWPALPAIVSATANLSVVWLAATTGVAALATALLQGRVRDNWRAMLRSGERAICAGFLAPSARAGAARYGPGFARADGSRRTLEASIAASAQGPLSLLLRPLRLLGWVALAVAAAAAWGLFASDLQSELDRATRAIIMTVPVLLVAAAGADWRQRNALLKAVGRRRAAETLLALQRRLIALCAAFGLASFAAVEVGWWLVGGEEFGWTSLRAMARFAALAVAILPGATFLMLGAARASDGTPFAKMRPLIAAMVLLMPTLVVLSVAGDQLEAALIDGRLAALSARAVFAAEIVVLAGLVLLARSTLEPYARRHFARADF